MSTTPAEWPPRAVPLAAAARLPVLVRLDAQELRRRVWHMAPGLLPFLLWPISHADPLSPTLRLIMVAVFLLLTWSLVRQWSRVARADSGTADRAAAVFGYAGSVVATLLLFPADAQCGLAVLGVLAFGDGSATLLGKMVGGPRLPWNAAKSVSGFLGFLSIGLPMTALIYWGESHNLEAVGRGATAVEALLVATAGVTAGALAESVRSRLNDNIRVGAAAAAGIVLTHAAIFAL